MPGSHHIMKCTAKEFNMLAAQISASLIASLPDDLRSEAEKILIQTSDHPSSEQMDGSGDELLGLYEGIPLSEKSMFSFQEHDRITIFRMPLLDMCSSKRELKNEIRLTLIHELGHHFGFSEEELIERGLD